MTGALMLQGTNSDAGKSLLVAGLCRVAANRGIAVTCFKPQNMSNNAAVTADGGEIGRAQWLQAVACRREPTVHMNPVLLKPQSDTGAQVVVHGKVVGTAEARAYQDRKPSLLGAVLESFETLKESADLVLVEGAGSPAETNLRAGDIANMGFAVAANVPVVLAGDIDRGGVIAGLVGTHAVLDEADRRMVRGFLINKFRGDVSLFDGGLAEITARTGWASFGVVPWLRAAADLPAEDAVVLERTRARGSEGVKIAVPMLSRIANFDDLDPLIHEPAVSVVFVPPGQPLPGDADLVVLPGTKSTVADLGFFRDQGWDIDLRAHLRRGGHVLGLCGGFQMLGTRVADPGGIEGLAGETEGLGLLDIETVIGPEKDTVQVRACDSITGEDIDGYEIHAGRTAGEGLSDPMLVLDGRPDGAVSADGRVMGCYVHGLFTSDAYRRAFLKRLGAKGGAVVNYRARIDTALDEIAEALEACLNVDGLLEVAAGARD